MPEDPLATRYAAMLTSSPISGCTRYVSFVGVNLLITATHPMVGTAGIASSASRSVDRKPLLGLHRQNARARAPTRPEPRAKCKTAARPTAHQHQDRAAFRAGRR